MVDFSYPVPEADDGVLYMPASLVPAVLFLIKQGQITLSGSSLNGQEVGYIIIIYQ